MHKTHRGLFRGLLGPTKNSLTDKIQNTTLKIINGIARILIEAKYLVDRKSMKLSPRDLHPVVRRYLAERNEKFVLDCLERTT